jgi:Ser/Thr protein kinase RdoA (MazF antagonist)
MNGLRIPKPGLILKKLSKKSEAWDLVWSKETIESILANYNLGSFQIVDDLGGGNSGNILIHTANGKKVLKKYFWSLDSTKYEHSIIKHLSDSGFISPQIVPNKNGLSYTVIKNNHYAIYDFIDGFRITDYYIPERIRHQCVSLAADTLATFHQLINGFTPLGKKLNGYMPDGANLWRDINWHLKILDNYVENHKINHLKSELADFIISIKGKLEQGIIETGKFFDRNNYRISLLVTHGDYSPKNVLFNKNRICAVLDFGDSNLNLRIVDVARGLSTFAKKSRVGIDKEISQIFLQSYIQKISLKEEEVDMITDLIRWRYYKNIIWILFNVMDVKFQRKDEMNKMAYILKKWDEILWIKENDSNIRRSLREIYKIKRAAI